MGTGRETHPETAPPPGDQPGRAHVDTTSEPAAGDRRKPAIILYAAADRYNFGDNLMPIVYRAFLQKYFPHELDRFDVRIAGIFRSDLSDRHCLPTESIRQFLTDRPSGHIVVVAGGEVLGATAIKLYYFCVNNPVLKRLVRVLMTRGRIASFAGKRLCGLDFDYPLVPPAKAFGPDAQVCFSAVGGKVTGHPTGRQVLLSRLKGASYVSFRDKRMRSTAEAEGIVAHIAPDCVSAFPDLFDDAQILTHVSQPVRDVAATRYHIFQATPFKTKKTPAETGQILKAATGRTGVPFILLPIGYATGHDDRDYLRACADASGLPLLDDLNVWEILWLLRNSQGYFGTSLHGAIVSLSYGRPHFIIGAVSKGRSYLQEWSMPPFAGDYGPDDIPRLAELCLQDDAAALSPAKDRVVARALDNMHALFHAAGLRNGDSPANAPGPTHARAG
ncbi:MAG: polysaccharide pyruvyl transferase family protein [Alkalilacustris sp.]